MAAWGDALAYVTGAVSAIAALGTAASGLVDGSKIFWGGVSRCGFNKLVGALTPFSDALVVTDECWADRKAANEKASPGRAPTVVGWRKAVWANWVNGLAMPDQKAAAKALILMGLTKDNAAAMAAAGHVNGDLLTSAVKQIAAGTLPALPAAEAVVLAQFGANIDICLSGAYQEADQYYRNAARAWAGVVAIVLAILGGGVIASLPIVAAKGVDLCGYFGTQPFWLAVLAGVIAVPLAPVAKDITSSLQAAATALKAKP